MRLAALLVAAAFCAPLHAQIPVKIYAQELVDETVARHPGLLAVVMHVTPPKGTGNVVIASNIGRIGKPGDDRLTIGGDAQAVEVALRDAVGENIGTLELVWQSRGASGNSDRVRDAIARRILNTANLLDPFPFERMATTRTFAQKLVDETQAKHPELAVLALRAPSRGAPELVVLGSTFGRHGKKADADDMKIFEAVEPVTGVYANGKRLGVDMPLADAAGRRIGTMNVGYANRPGDDPRALLAQALRLREEIQQRIPDAAALDELDP
jgi:hypothetical protein